jgi:hypothetical protein
LISVGLALVALVPAGARDAQGDGLHRGAALPPKKLDYEPERGERPEYGYIGLQNHSDNDIVFFKEVAVRPVK